jgi:hypothetical protein
MQKTRKNKLSQLAVFSALILGIALVAISAVYASSFIAILGVAIVFWSALLLYIKPVKHVPLALLNASVISSTSNIERILSEANLTEKGRYLPPRYLKNFESSIIFIPEQPEQSMPKLEEVTEEKLLSPNRTVVFLTPPGLALSQLFEKQLGTSFTKNDLKFVQQKFSELIVERMEIAKTASLQIQNGRVTIELTGNVLSEICQETRNMPRTHAQVGCLLSSAIACVLAKATGKAVTIQKDEQSSDGKTTRIEYQIIGE